MKSCGCQSGGATHGLTRGGKRSRTAVSHSSMISRCYHESNGAFAHYNGRGITVCDRWRFGEGGKSGLECFFLDMGERPAGKTLDRIEGTKGYEPGNCRWATPREQNSNLRTNRFFDFNGEQLTIPEIARRTGLPKEKLRHRLVKAGWSVEDAVSLQACRGRRTDLHKQRSP